MVSDFALQWTKGNNAVKEQEHFYDKNIIEYTCKIQWYSIYMLIISSLGIIAFVIFNAKNLKLFKGHFIYFLIE